MITTLVALTPVATDRRNRRNVLSVWRWHNGAYRELSVSDRRDQTFPT